MYSNIQYAYINEYSILVFTIVTRTEVYDYVLVSRKLYKYMNYKQNKQKNNKRRRKILFLEILYSIFITILVMLYTCTVSYLREYYIHNTTGRAVEVWSDFKRTHHLVRVPHVVPETPIGGVAL